MTAPSHIGLGLASFVALSRIAGLSPGALDFLAVLLGSLLPDLDGQGSITRPGTIMARFLPRFLVDLLDSLAAFFSTILRLLFGHRGALHYPTLPLILFAIGAFNGSDFVCWLSWGYFWHLLGDMLTTGGIPLFGPFSRRRFSLARLRTGSLQECFLCLSLWLSVCVFGFALLPKATQNAFERFGQFIYQDSNLHSELANR